MRVGENHPATGRQLSELTFQLRLQQHLKNVARGQPANGTDVARALDERHGEAVAHLGDTAPDALTRYLVLQGHLSYGEGAAATTAVSLLARQIQGAGRPQAA
ncbi:MAG: hypothetical protein H6704_07975 [Myxococcales bacterium]|nr:hypothetical protein [Myxococcales bacterium]